MDLVMEEKQELCCYLSSRNLVHRDVAARNVLLTKDLIAKIGDFGLCRYVDQALYTAKGGRLPIKWMAIESLKQYEYTTQSDVWSYGVLLFELFSLGDGPFPTVQPQDMIVHLEEGNRNEKPKYCPDEIYTLMCRCWDEKPTQRPTFTEIATFLSEMLQIDDAANDYLQVINDDNDGYLKASSLARNSNLTMRKVSSLPPICNQNPSECTNNHECTSETNRKDS